MRGDKEGNQGDLGTAISDPGPASFTPRPLSHIHTHLLEALNGVVSINHDFRLHDGHQASSLKGRRSPGG